MGARHSGREAALQILFALDVTKQPAAELLAVFWKSFDADPEGREHAHNLVMGVIDHLTQLDDAISSCSQHWRLDRMNRVDRNLLRIAAYEMIWSDVPRLVVIDESVELAKSFGTEQSPSFVNGILHQLGLKLSQKK